MPFDKNVWQMYFWITIVCQSLFQRKMMFHLTSGCFSLEFKQSHTCFAKRQPSYFSMQQKRFMWTSHSSHRILKRYVFKGQHLITFIICGALSRTFFSELSFWCKYMAVKNTITSVNGALPWKATSVLLTLDFFLMKHYII